MRGCRLGLGVFAALWAMIAAAPAQAQTPAAQAFALARADATVVSAAPLLQPVFAGHHRKRAQAYYCYPRNHWWFYRPYTTAKQGYERCMPYFHYPSYGRGGAKGYVK